MYLDIVADLLYEIVDLVDLLHDNRVLRRAVELQQDTLRAVDVIRIYQRRVQGIADGISNTAFARSSTDIHDRYSTLAQGVAYVRKVRIDIPRHGDNLRNRAGGISHHIVGFGERIEQVQLRIDLFQFLIINNKECIHMFRQTRYAGHRLLNLLLSLKSKRNSNDSDGEDTHLLRHLSHYCRSAGTRSTAHAGRDKQHLRTVVQRLADMIPALLGILTRGLRIASGT